MKQIILTVLISAAVSVVGLFVYDRFFSQKIAVVDVQAFLKKQVELQAAGKMQDVETNFRELEKKLDSSGKRTVILPSTVVLRGGERLEIE